MGCCNNNTLHSFFINSLDVERFLMIIYSVFRLCLIVSEGGTMQYKFKPKLG